ncbi:phospholipase D-like domain-containing protein [Acidothermaceae bacterium B102]|nr:phospholipase D-like domain-containing protein [Acidothermaceae bacterium B102]
MTVVDWMLTARERRNDASTLYRDRGDDAWSHGNRVRPLVHGAAYFAQLLEELRELGAGDQVYLADWRGDPDELLDGPGTAIGVELARAASAGALVHGLIWRSHLDRLRMSSAENRMLSEVVNNFGGRLLLDQRVRRVGSHHQKFVVIRHPDRPADDVAFVGGIDLSHSRNDTADHHGDPQTQTMAEAYGPTPPWHDVQVEIRGPAVADVETCFRERWADPAPLRQLHPWMYVSDRIRGDRDTASPLPDQLPAPPEAGPHTVQLLRTYPSHSPRYPFAPLGERSVALGYRKAIARAERLIYLEDQFLWSGEIAGVFADALRRAPELRLVAVVPRHCDQDGHSAVQSAGLTHREALEAIHEAGGDRVTIVDIENHAGTPVYVHAKVCVVDDTWAAVGSANLNMRSWTHDSELTATVVNEAYARDLRLRLMAEHLDRAMDDVADLVDPVSAADTVRATAHALDDWWDQDRQGARPPGRVRRHHFPDVEPATHQWAPPLNRLVNDPDGRPFGWRRANRW